jgi:hypothetical protein
MISAQLKATMSFSYESGQKRWNSQLKRFSRRLMVLMNRLWWHIKGYGTVFGMMIIVLLSMVFLYLHSLITKRFSLKDNEAEGKLWKN